MHVVHHSDALSVLRGLPAASIDLVYADPPFGTGEVQSSHGMSYVDVGENHQDFLRLHVEEFSRVLKPTGTLYLHLDWRSCYYARVECNVAFGSRNFLNEVIWSYNYGGRSKDRWPRKHDNILVYTKEVGKHVFNVDAIDRIPYRAPAMQKVGRTPDEAAARIARGQVPTDVWDIGIIGTNATERTGYPSQKPRKLLERIVATSSPPGGTVLDVFAGSGTTGDAAHRLGRQFVLADVNPQAIAVMRQRFQGVDVDWRATNER